MKDSCFKYSLVILFSTLLVNCESVPKDESEEEDFSTVQYMSYTRDCISLYIGLREKVCDTVRYLDYFSFWIGTYKDLQNEIPGHHVGVAASTPKSWHTYQWLVSNMNLKEAEILYHHPDNAIKGIALEALYNNYDSNFSEKFIESFNDDSTYIYKSGGCLGNQYKLSSYFIEIVYPQGLYSSNGLFLKDDVRLLDSLIMDTSDSAWFANYRNEIGYSFN